MVPSWRQKSASSGARSRTRLSSPVSSLLRTKNSCFWCSAVESCRGSSASSWPETCRSSTVSVSYTHLDVYKRQQRLGIFTWSTAIIIDERGILTQ